MPSDSDLKGVNLVVLVPSFWKHTLKNVDTKIQPWSVCNSFGIPKQVKNWSTSTLATVVTSWSGMAKASSYSK